MEPFEKRLVEEYLQLTDRHKKLSAFINSEAINAIDPQQGKWLNVQSAAMQVYKIALENRLSLLCILPVPDDANNDARPLQRPERPLQRPAAYPLSECLKELKFSRPAKGQEFLDRCISELHEYPECNTPFK